MVAPGKKVRIIMVEGGIRCRQCLAELGVYPGDTIKVIRSAPFSGPILIEANGGKVMIGRGMASKIIVEEVS
ncbi:MAG TPA: ferrous iron transport protein A [Candidatus Desulfofervidus auxilii]|uniref:Ferrous iron transport protein A n=1 Tax=Desulfofervidus auxilii TaxID=1621989 RepID=A0A7V0NEA7_DESA2|nr:ferrous iron transport protein A [Candidatus Desulfofervidus auxilii]